MRVTLREAKKFHGHLGPYLVLGILAGELAIKKLKCKKYFGLKVKIWGADEKPKSCIVDGLQLSTGATYGKGNINKFDGSSIKIEIKNKANKKKAVLKFKNSLIRKLAKTKTHRDSELLARKLYNVNCYRLFDLQLIT